MEAVEWAVYPESVPDCSQKGPETFGNHSEAEMMDELIPLRANKKGHLSVTLIVPLWAACYCGGRT